MNKRKFDLKTLAEIAIFAALAFALDALQGGYSRGIFPSGGSIGLAMLPIFIVSYRRGLIPGLLCGLVVSLIQMLSSFYVINATNYENAFTRVVAITSQVALDYVLAYTVVGFAGAFSKKYSESKTKSKKILYVVLGTCLGGLLKYLLQSISGGLFWLDPSIEFLGVNGGTWWYSFFYNGMYGIPNTILCVIFMIIITNIYPQFLDVNYEKENAGLEE